VFLRFRVANHASIRDEQELSLIALDPHEDLAVADVPDTSQQVLPVTAIYGANASGKSNVIDSLAFMRKVVIDSHQRWLPDDPIPRRPFLLDEESATRPSTYIADFALGKIRYEYGFSVTETAVTEEWLYHWPTHRRNVLFERDDKGQIKYGTSFPNRRTHAVSKPRTSGLLLSAGAVDEHPILLPIYRWFRTGLYPALNHTFDERLSLTMSEFSGDTLSAARTLLQFADLGVEDIRVQSPVSHFTGALAAFRGLGEREMPSDQTRLYYEALSKRFDQIPLEETISKLEQIMPTVPTMLSKRLTFVHRGQSDTPISATLNLDQESSGTRTWLGLVGPLLKALRDGTVLIVDELDAHLHPHLAARLIGLFQSPKTNPRGAQLIFNTHDVTLMNRSTEYRLHRDQVYFAEKDPDEGATRLYPLTEFARVRDNLDNLERWYLSSRLGAVPIFRDSLLAELAESVAG